MSSQFIQDTVHNQIADKLKMAFFNNFHYYPGDAEVNSWQNSLRAISLIFQNSNLLDHGVILEYQLPQTSKRLDCMICGKDSYLRENAVIIELKQWQKCESSPGEHELTTWLNGSKREVLHPSIQVGQYKQYLQDYHTAFYDGVSPVLLNACSYLHNYPFSENDVLYSEKFQNDIENFPLFTKDEVDRLENYLVQRLSKGEGNDVLKRIEDSRYRPSKKLMEHVSNVIRGISEYVLLDEQQVVYDMVRSEVKKGFIDGKKTVIIVKGGPGTGKSVIAMNLMADLSSQGYNTHYATGSRAFTGTLREIIGKRSTLQLRHFNQYAEAQENEVDVLIADEAHRMWARNIDRFTRRELRSNTPIVEQMIKASKVAVFFVDDLQIIRPEEVGSASYIEEHAKKMYTNIFNYKLDVQFRCNGSDAFINWINNTLDIEPTANVIWSGADNFDFRIFDNPEDLENAILEKAKAGKKSRLVAGFCWSWSNPKEDGTLPFDVVIGDYRRPWNAKSGSTKSRLADKIPIEKLWAHDPNGIKQIGCVYTAQGFEFDYVGVIFGNDLTYDFASQSWKGHPENSRDPAARRSKDKFTKFVKNTYRVLLSRGMEGCYVYFADKETEWFFKSRMDKSTHTT